MTLQDLVIAGANVGFTILLLPTIVDKRSAVPLLTSGTTGALLGIEAAVFLSLRLDFSFVATLVSALAWLTIAVLRRPRSSSQGTAVART